MTTDQEPLPTGRKRFWWLGISLALFLAVVTGLLFYPSPPPSVPMPVYQGRTLKEWLHYASDGKPTDKHSMDAEAAIHQMGTNALPALVQMLDFEYFSIWQPYLKILLSKKGDPFAGPAVLLGERYLARRGFRILGAEAKPAVPGILRLLHSRKGILERIDIIKVLELIGPAAKEALPDLLAIAKSGERGQRGAALEAIVAIHSDPESCVPFLVRQLSDTDQIWRAFVAQSIGSLGPAAQSAVPRLTELLVDPDKDVRECATNALQRIDPAAAAAAGIK